MRLWSLHPSLLDRQGLTALWREALLAQAVLAGRTRGYRHHPQLERFQQTADPLGALANYLDGVRAEATARGYSYDPGRIDDVARWGGTITVTTGQLELELAHLRAKLAARSPQWLEGLGGLQGQDKLAPHPIFVVEPGPVASWERAAPPAGPGTTGT